MRILIAIQTLHVSPILKEMTRDLLSTIKSQHRWSVIVDDLDDDTLSNKWNRALKYSIRHDFDYVIFLNNDTLLKEDTIDKLIEFADTHPQYPIVSATQYFEGQNPVPKDEIIEDSIHWAMVAMRPSIVKEFGEFDSIFKGASFMDTDYSLRMHKAGKKIARTCVPLYLHYDSTTNRIVKEKGGLLMENDQKYHRKWGLDLEYDTPYDDPNLDLNFTGEYGTQK